MLTKVFLVKIDRKTPSEAACECQARTCSEYINACELEIQATVDCERKFIKMEYKLKIN